ncbi:MAG: hypothetical protein VKK62_00835 [Synechococcaceae cyanobacterium]|nr:hypothetical protein [Synechococcaceae cyanobacterium]
MNAVRAGFDESQLEDLQGFVRDWLRHAGRTQADLRRALRAESIRMPVLLEELQRIRSHQGLLALVDRLCSIEALWLGEDGGDARLDEEDFSGLASSFGQLDLLLQEIREEQQA